MRAWCKRHPMGFLMLFFCVYMAAFETLELLVQPRFLIHCPLDDLIPFTRFAIIPYCIWYAWVPFTLLYLLRRDRDSFWLMCRLLVTGVCISLALYAIFPSGLALRRPIAGNDFLSRAVLLLRQVDTPTNVCPSLHVFCSVLIVQMNTHSPVLRRTRFLYGFNRALCPAVCASTVLLDQHSCVDVVCGILLAILVYEGTMILSQPRVSRSLSGRRI